LVPRQLPKDVAGFTGRREAPATLTGLLAGAEGRTPPTVAVAAVVGAARVGKTALAVQAARRLAGWFPDGQLYVDLHGATAGLPPRSRRRSSAGSCAPSAPTRP
jgi:hypothetical protein